MNSITDRNGHTYRTPQEVLDAIEWLETDAEYLQNAATQYQDRFVRDRVESNAKNSRTYADELRAAIAEQD